MAGNLLAELVSVGNNKLLAESGGGHNQKGIEFQKNWALVQMFALENRGDPDFLFLFEAIQDVAILDSTLSPKNIALFQIKKKDRGEWSWASITKLHQPADPANPKKKQKVKPLKEVEDSPIGKLHAAVAAFQLLQSEGRFISNAGCDLVMADGSNAATSLPVQLASLPTHYRDLLIEALSLTPSASGAPPDLSKLTLERVDLPVDDPLTYTIGCAHKFLLSRSPKHAGQAQSLVESLLVKLGPLGAKTAACKNFDEMRSQHGYGRAEFVAALASLEEVLDLEFYLNLWLEQLQTQGMGFMEVTAIRVAVAGIYRRQVMGGRLDEEVSIAHECDAWLSSNSDPSNLMWFFQSGVSHLKSQFPFTKHAELQAHFALRAITKCVGQS